MYFEYDASGRILVCADEIMNPRMVWLEPPAGFTPGTMHDWRVVDGALVYDPLPVEVRPTPEERIAALEAQLASYETAYAEGVKDA